MVQADELVASGHIFQDKQSSNLDEIPLVTWYIWNPWVS